MGKGKMVMQHHTSVKPSTNAAVIASDFLRQITIAVFIARGGGRQTAMGKAGTAAEEQMQRESGPKSTVLDSKISNFNCFFLLKTLKLPKHFSQIFF